MTHHFTVDRSDDVQEELACSEQELQHSGFHIFDPQLPVEPRTVAHELEDLPAPSLPRMVAERPESAPAAQVEQCQARP